MERTSLGDRMKQYETLESGRRLMPGLPVLARIDGRSFSHFTRDLQRPFDPHLSRVMIDTTRFLVEETGALAGYTQSDEISLMWHNEDPEVEMLFDGRIQKLSSVLAAISTVEFNRLLRESLPSHVDRRPVFDCRVWSVPSREEAANTFLWRERDATKNSVSMAARAFYSHLELHGKSSRQMQAMLLEKDVNWNDYPSFFKRGTFVQRKPTLRRFTTSEIESLPPKHHARIDSELEYERWETLEIEMPPFGRVRNRVDVLFARDTPIVGDSELIDPDSDAS